ncbi:hypothetical protein ACIA8O_20230 [Kitasatospora sp. NPDC051853]|uniref:hypothetical protein n=1 Tax=Kitasatospora sp. NPDC051853 TaxID=3364058 RepID=UPI0037A950CC
MDAARTLAWQYAARLVAPEDLPMAAAELLVGGHDAPALRELAGLSGREHPNDLDAVLRRSMDELGNPVPEEAPAERYLLHHVAARVDTGGLTPSAAFDLLRPDWYGEDLAEAEQRLFDALTDAYCCADCLAQTAPAEFTRWEAGVRAAAAALLASGEDPTAP